MESISSGVNRYKHKMTGKHGEHTNRCELLWTQDDGSGVNYYGHR